MQLLRFVLLFYLDETTNKEMLHGMKPLDGMTDLDQLDIIYLFYQKLQQMKQKNLIFLKKFFLVYDFEKKNILEILI
jgi:hypothetical protein